MIRWRWRRDSENSVECEFQLAKQGTWNQGGWHHRWKPLTMNQTFSNVSWERFSLVVVAAAVDSVWAHTHTRTRRNLMSAPSTYSDFVISANLACRWKNFLFSVYAFVRWQTRQRNSLIQNPLEVLRSKYLCDEQKWNLMLFQMAGRVSIRFFKIMGLLKNYKKFIWLNALRCFGSIKWNQAAHSLRWQATQ